MDCSEKDENEIGLKMTIRSDSLSLSEIENVFVGVPDIKLKIGDLVRGKVLIKHNSCSFSSRHKVNGTDLDKHWDWLLLAAKPTEKARDIILKCEGMLDICGYLYDRPFIGLSNKSLQEIADLGLSFGWDVYDFSE